MDIYFATIFINDINKVSYFTIFLDMQSDCRNCRSTNS